MFYYSNNRKLMFSNRIEALNNDSPFSFYYFDNEFNKVSWTEEPTESLPDLYRQRAEQLRQDYEYLILAYSGGSDSHNILETFYYNNIHIDEILLVGAFSQDSNKGDENHNGEIYNMAIPTISKLKFPNTKITTFDYTTLFSDINNFSLIKKYGDDWIYHIGSFYSVHNLFWNDLKQLIGKNNDKNTGIIFGFEKPNYKWDFNRKAAYTAFSDLGVTSYGNFQKEDNFERVCFYSDPKAEKIIRKQLHVINNFFIEKCLNKNNPTLLYSNYSKIINKLVYFPKNPILYTSPKSPTNILSIRDSYILNKKNSDIYKMYIAGIKKFPANYINVKREVDSFFSMSSFLSKRYYITNTLNV